MWRSNCYAILPARGRILQSLNLKNPKAYTLASELSHLTGESLTAAVITALEQRLERERQERATHNSPQEMLAFIQKFASHMRPGCRSEDHADLYGEDGLPR
jgi:antitoxin VapB